MSTDFLRRSWAEIDLDALRQNYINIRAAISPGAKLCTVVKADAYGHGALRFSAELQALGTEFFGVSNLEEALQIRNSGIVLPILILGYTPVEYAPVLAEADISQCIYSTEYAKELSLNAAKHQLTVKVHIKVDTGMGRLGFAPQQGQSCVNEIAEVCALPGLDCTGIFTHFAVSDEGEDGQKYTMSQYGLFTELVKELAARDIAFDICHCANSGGIMDYPQTHMDLVRAGIILYGLYPSNKIRNRIPLTPVLSLKSVVSHVKTVKEGSSVSYGRIFTADHELRIATVPIGYADGYPRIMGQRRAEVLIHGQRCKISGRVCMDQLMVDISHLGEVNIGDTVTLIGRDGDEIILADEVAAVEESINYEVVCDIGKRVPRVYIKNGRVESVLNQLLPETNK